MALKKPNHSLIVVALYKITATEGIKWSDITAAIESEYQVKNWLTMVRTPLQALKNAGLLARTPDLNSEVWYRIPTDNALSDQEVLRAVGLAA